MTKFGFAGKFRWALFAATFGAFAAPAIAQDNKAAQSDSAVDGAAVRVVQEDSIAPYQVRSDETEYLPGRLRVVDPRTGGVRAVRTTGLLVVQNGRVVGRAETGVGGVAQISTLPPGPYSVIAIGPDGMGAFGMEVLPPASGVAAPTYRFDTLIVPAVDMAVAQRLLAVITAPPTVPTSAPRPSPLPPIPAALKKQLVKAVPVQLADAAADLADHVASTLRDDPVVIPPGEPVTGQLVTPGPSGPVPIGNARVFVLRGGQHLGTIETDSEGYFAAEGLEDGVYSVVGKGAAGFVATGMEVRTVDGAVTAGVDVPVTRVAFLQGPSPNVQISGAGSDAGGFAPGLGGPGAGPGPFGPGGLAGGPFGPGGPGGGAGGGTSGGGGGPSGGGGLGGGAGGGGLLGALLGAGLGAGLGAALGQDDDDEPPPFQSPFDTPGQGPPIIPPGQGGTPPGQQ